MTLEEQLRAALEANDELERQNERLLAALKPFAVPLPDNWPGYCVLTWNARPGWKGGEYACINYLGIGTEADGAPRIADYRRAAELLAELEGAS